MISDGAGMLLDAVSGGATDSSRTVTGTDPFEVDLVVSRASSPYQGYQYQVQWDPKVLAYDDQRDLKPAGLELCAAGAKGDDSFFSGCARPSDSTDFTGPVNTLTFHCIADGTSTVHLVKLAEDEDFGSSVLGFGGVIIETTLTDALVTCQRMASAPTLPPS
jgi:hypothetical protein